MNTVETQADPSASIPPTAVTQASIVQSKDSAEFSTVFQSDDASGNTDEVPEGLEIVSVGENTAKLSELSNRIEKEQNHTQSKGTLANLVRRIRPMIHGRFMAFLAIANLVLFILIILSVVAILALLGVTLYYYLGPYKSLEKKQHHDQCAVIWGEWDGCTKNCTDRSQTAYTLPTRTRRPITTYGDHEGCNYNNIREDTVFCNLHSCHPPHDLDT